MELRPFREVKLSLAKELFDLGYHIVLGNKLCPNCRIQATTRIHDDVKKSGVYNIDEMNDDEECDKDAPTDTDRESLNALLEDIEVSLIKLHSLPKHAKLSHGKRKLAQVKEGFSKKVAKVLEVDTTKLTQDDGKQQEQSEVLMQKARDLDELVELMKKKLKISNRSKTLQVLTLVPDSWSVRKAAAEFNVSKQTIQKARVLKQQKGILEMPDVVGGNRIQETIRELVQDFYCDNEYTRQLPGKKDCVSIGQKQYMSKRLILGNIKELYAAFKARHPDAKIGFSTFAALRPKWCIPVGPKGSHIVCVCTHHENVKLLLDVEGLKDHYHEILEMVVCDINNKKCMIHRCQNCPCIENVESFLRRMFCNG